MPSTKSKVAVIFSSPETVLDDIALAMNLADYSKHLVKSSATSLKINISCFVNNRARFCARKNIVVYARRRPGKVCFKNTHKKVFCHIACGLFFQKHKKHDFWPAACAIFGGPAE